MKLISTTDFAINQNSIVGDYRNAVFNYAKFLKQPLELWMFVPCDKKGNILEEKSIFNTTDDDYIFDSESFETYKEAKNRVLFYDFKFVESHKIGIENNLELFIFPYGDKRFGLTKKENGFRTWFQLFTIEDLVQCDLSLAVSF